MSSDFPPLGIEAAHPRLAEAILMVKGFNGALTIRRSLDDPDELTINFNDEVTAHRFARYAGHTEFADNVEMVDGTPEWVLQNLEVLYEQK